VLAAEANRVQSLPRAPPWRGERLGAERLAGGEKPLCSAERAGGERRDSPGLRVGLHSPSGGTRPTGRGLIGNACLLELASRPVGWRLVAPLGATQAFRFTETQLATDLTGGSRERSEPDSEA
jgi:hypothetical protein